MSLNTDTLNCQLSLREKLPFLLPSLLPVYESLFHFYCMSKQLNQPLPICFLETQTNSPFNELVNIEQCPS
jgi:hypothetical protein